MTVFTPEDVYFFSRQGNVDKLAIALNHSDNICNWFRNREGWTALHTATNKGHIECVGILLDKGADIHAKDCNGNTALHLVKIHGHLFVGILLDRGANIDEKNNRGNTPLHITAARGYLEGIGILLDRGADIHNMDDDGNTACHIASRFGHRDCIVILLNRGADIHSRNNEGQTPLHIAANLGYMECLVVILDRGSDIDEKDDEGNTALDIVANLGHIECVNILLDRGADIHSKNNDGNTALHNAHVDCVGILLDKGADINEKNNNGKTALTIATYYGRVDCVGILLERGAIIEDDTNKYQPYSSWATDCRPMILTEIDHRRRRNAFDLFINHHIEYQLYINNIYSRCYPTGNLLVAKPPVGWTRAETARDKYYFDEIFFYLHLHIANLCGNNERNEPNMVIATSMSRIKLLANRSSRTSTLMTVLTDRLKVYLRPNTL